MIYIAIGAFYLTTEQLKNSPSKKDDIDMKQLKQPLEFMVVFSSKK
ncbi:unnamed protein product, partial [Vitis vinifera]|uniref:Uncharacterized protein n=1 Tax=Vitis vinifera TaxID=29760 RepID=D7T2B6_VITVI